MKMTFKLIAVTALTAITSVTLSAKSGSGKLAPLTKKAIDKHEMCIEVKTVCPNSAPSFSSIDGYKLTIKDGKVNAHLPFFGESYTAVIAGVDETGIVFEDFPIDITEDYSKAKKKGKYVWMFKADSGHDHVDVTITFWDNGSADISCVCSTRSGMSYLGELVEIEKGEK